MALAKAEILDAISSMTVLELSSSSRTWKRSSAFRAAAAVAVAARRPVVAVLPPPRRRPSSPCTAPTRATSKVNVIKVVRAVTGWA